MTIDEFRQTDLRVGKITAAERVEGSEKLVKLQVDLGAELGARQLVAGIGKSYAPEALVGREIIVVANLDPRQLMGLTSQGMLLAAHGENGEPVLLMPVSPVAPGSTIS